MQNNKFISMETDHDELAHRCDGARYFYHIHPLTIELNWES